MIVPNMSNKKYLKRAISKVTCKQNVKHVDSQGIHDGCNQEVILVKRKNKCPREKNSDNLSDTKDQELSLKTILQQICKQGTIPVERTNASVAQKEPAKMEYTSKYKWKVIKDAKHYELNARNMKNKLANSCSCTESSRNFSCCPIETVSSNTKANSRKWNPKVKVKRFNQDLLVKHQRRVKGSPNFKSNKDCLNILDSLKVKDKSNVKVNLKINDIMCNENCVSLHTKTPFKPSRVQKRLSIEEREFYSIIQARKKSDQFHEKDSNDLITDHEMKGNVNYVKSMVVTQQGKLLKNIKLNMEGCIDLMKENIYFGNTRASYSVEPALYKRPIFQHVKLERCCYVQRGAGKMHFDCGHNWKFQECGYLDRMLPTNWNFVCELIKKMLLSHDTERLSISLLPLCYFPHVFPEILWKIGSKLLKCTQAGVTLLPAFQNLTKILLFGPLLPDVYLDIAATALVRKNDIHDSYQVLTEVASKENISHDIYFSVFYGQLEYVLWKNEVRRIAMDQNANTARQRWADDSDDSDEEETGQSQHHGNNSRITFHGQRALKCLKHVEERMGIWDRILPKYIELLHYFEGRQRVVTALKKHLANNRYNPSAHRFLYLAMNETVCVDEELMQILISLGDIDPTNGLLKDLVLYYKKKGLFDEQFDLIVKRLDHVACYNSLFDWQQLLHLLQTSASSTLVKVKLKDMSKIRPVWGKVHFALNFRRNESPTVSEIRNEIANILQLDGFSNDTAEMRARKTIERIPDAVTFRPLLRRITLGDLSDPFSDDELSTELLADEDDNYVVDGGDSQFVTTQQQCHNHEDGVPAIDETMVSISDTSSEDDSDSANEVSPVRYRLSVKNITRKRRLQNDEMEVLAKKRRFGGKRTKNSLDDTVSSVSTSSGSSDNE